MTEQVWLVFWAALVTALATGLGALPFFFVKKVTPRFAGYSNALAAGLMGIASVQLLLDGFAKNSTTTLAGLLGGVLFIWLSHEFLERKGIDFNPEALMQPNVRKMILIVAIMTVHSFAEGISIGFAFGETRQFGLLIALALAIHNIPEGLAISAVLCPRGVSPIKAVGWSIFTSLPQPLMAVPAFLFVQAFAAFLPIGLGFAAGAMLWLVFTELLQEAKQEIGWLKTGLVITFASVAMLLISAILSY